MRILWHFLSSLLTSSRSNDHVESADQEDMMDKALQELVARARKIQMSEEQIEAQRRSFAYGNAKIENSNVTREIVDAAALRLARGDIQVVDVPRISIATR